MRDKMDRREFLRTVGVAGVGLAAGPLAAGTGDAPDSQRPATSDESAAGLTAPPLETVRVGVIGVGARGSGHVGQLLTLEGVEVRAICDIYEPATQRSVKRCVDAGRPEPAGYSNGPTDYKRMLERDDIDIVVIASPWEWHVPQAVDAMNAGKHAFTEVPAAYTVDGCWQLVETAEKTRKHCMMMENVCYGREELTVLHMCRLGVFGDLLHGEAAYLHDLRGQMHQIERGTGSWRTLHHTRRNGNLYPTHGLGPVAQYMSINRGDRMDFLTSVSSPALGRTLYAEEQFPPDHMRNQAKYVCGDINTSLIKTVKGRTIMVQWDTTTPRPYSRLNVIKGTKGEWGGFPTRVVIEGRSPNTHSWQQGDDLNAFYEEFEHPLWKRMGVEAEKAGGHGGMDFLMLWRLIYCLRNGEAMDQDVYDAAAWSVISPLSERSVANRGQSVDVPDFTRGKWKTTKPLGIVS
ncbi:MAG: Gfo/Idh/MocA family oxidoreductase [Armatimonadetes bacterium]|nr:Gfo/Idh/MocA family oxidoreductase [Armatimonadota bacterium]